MWQWNDGMGMWAFGGGWMIIIWLVIIGLIAWGVIALIKHQSSRSDTGSKQSPLDIAKERGVEIEDADKIHPAKLAHQFFRQLIPELKA